MKSSKIVNKLKKLTGDKGISYIYQPIIWEAIHTIKELEQSLDYYRERQLDSKDS